MRLDDMDTSDVEVDDQRGSGRGGFGFPMGGGGLPLGRQMGCGTLALVIIIALVFGVNPMRILGGDMAPTPRARQALLAKGAMRMQQANSPARRSNRRR